jgi:thiamine-phosphate pyrophosphorylase
VLDFRLYAISDRRLLDPIEFINRAAPAGLRAFQLREKDLSTRKILSFARQIRATSCKIFINDRVDVALSAGAAGVHVPEASWPMNRFKQTFPGIVSGVSVHSIDSATRAEEEGADFLLFGPIFETPGKEAKGLPALHQLTGFVSIPVYAVGGMTPDRAQQCREAGAHGVAAIRDLMTAPNILERLAEYEEALGSL